MPPIPLMGLADSWAGWSAAGLCRTSRSASVKADATTAPSRAATFAGTDGEAFTSARTTRCCARPAPCTTATRFAIALPSLTAMSVRSTQRRPNTPARQVPRDVHEHARNVARRLMRTKAFLKSRDERKSVEMRFAHLKTHHGFERMRLRGFLVRATSSSCCHRPEPQNARAPNRTLRRRRRPICLRSLTFASVVPTWK